MQVTGQAPVIFGASVAQVQIAAVAIDPNANRITVTYANPNNGAQTRTASGPLSAPGLSAIANEVGALLEAAEGWTALPTINTTPAANASNAVIKGP